MAVVQNTLIGRASGQVGNTIFQKWKSLNILRSMPVSVANPNTPAQQSHRGRVSFIGSFYKQIKPVVDIGLAYYGRSSSPSAYFQKLNTVKAVLEPSTGVFFPNPQFFVFSKGDMPKTPITNLILNTGTSNDSVQIQWDFNYLPAGLTLDDVALSVAVSLNTGEVRYAIGGGRFVGSSILYFGRSFIPNEGFVVMLAFKNQNYDGYPSQRSGVSDNVNGFIANV